jgi:hypothetical protein
VEGRVGEVKARSATVLLVAAAVLSAPGLASASNVSVQWYAQQVSSERASIGASVEVSYRTAGQHGGGAARPDGGRLTAPVVLTLTTNSPRLRDPTPAGPDSFWYSDVEGRSCVYLPNSLTPCYNVVAPGGQPAAPAVNPVAVAASAARRLDLTLGRIVASPSARAAGLTGAASWFWLEPEPGTRSVSVSLEGERVTVTADAAAVEWRFGDGVVRQGGPGRPYRRGRPPEGSVRHRYETRCLPGDQGRNPYVLASCGSDGYRVDAVVTWGISYRASGPVSASGSLPGRTTETSMEYPVSEARAFLAPGGGR